MDMSKYREMFLSETREHLESMNQLIVSLEKNPADREGVDTLFREAHSIKGMAASMGYQQMTSLGHYLEDFLDQFRAAGELPGDVFDRLLAGVDLLGQLLEDISAERPERDVAGFLTADTEAPDTAPVEAEVVAETEQRSPVIVSLMVILSDQAVAPAARGMLLLKECERFGQLVESHPALSELSRGGMLKKLSVILQTTTPAEQIEAALAEMPDVERVELQAPEIDAPVPRRRKEDQERTVRVKTDLLDQFINLTGELMTNRTMLQNAARHQDWPALHEGLDQLTRLVANLHHQVLQVRMMPLGSITGRLPRLMRELCQGLGKEIRLEISGEEIELDRSILEKLADPLVHLLRNAADHGIEQSGTVTLRAWREKDLVLVELTDDGRGMDPQLIRSKAVERGLLSRAQAEQLPESELLLLVCQPGFSTKDAVSETSGRGVGMDIVKASVEGLGGNVELSLPAGGGTRVLLKLPLSVAIIRVLLVQCAGQIMALPITRVQRTLELSRDELKRSGRQLVISYEDEVLPLLSLRKILELKAQPAGTGVPIVVTEIRGRRVGLVVDQLVGQQEVFVKALEFPLNKVAGIAGATMLGSGQVVFVLDPQGLLDAGRVREERSEA
ncbi:MAG TPA: chemotaxis protein CheA [Geothermobacteraceae bacterium]|nr:chemotaxis protein CheA [Geothermobacteraceae bacterium]